MNEMMAIDAAGGTGKGGVSRPDPAPPETASQQRSVVAALCTPDNPRGLPQPAPATADPQLNIRWTETCLKLIFGRLSWDAIPLHEPILLATFVGVAAGRHRAFSRCSPSTACGARCGATGSPASTTRRSASCT